MNSAGESFRATLSNNAAFVLMVCLFSVSLGFNVYFGRLVQVRSRSLPQQSLTKSNGEVAVGGRPKFKRIIDLEGQPASIDNSGKKLIYYFSPTCVWCKRNIESFRSLTTQIDPKIEVIGIVDNANGVKEYSSVNKLPFRIVVDKDGEDVATLALHGTPQTVLVTDGIVAHNWPGAYQGKVKASIEHELGVSLPNLQ